MSDPIPHTSLLVLDTNVILDWIAFDDARVYPLVSAIESGVWRAATSPACLQELRRALAYVQVKLEPAAQALAFERYLAHSVVLEFPDAALAPDLPRLPVYLVRMTPWLRFAAFLRSETVG